MAEPAEPLPSGSLRALVEELVLAALGAAAIARERAEAVVDELAERGKVSKEEAARLLEELVPTRENTRRLTERTASVLSGLFHDLGVVTERQHAELELRVAQLEHRLRLLEGDQERREPGQATRP